MSLTQEVTGILERELQLIGFWDNIPARNRLKGELQKVLLAPESVRQLPQVVQKRQAVITRIMELAQKNNDTIRYAA